MNDRSSARPAGMAAFIPRPTPPKKPVRPSVRPPAARAAPEKAQPVASLEPTILLVGADSTFEPALRAALARHHVYVETTTADSAGETVIATAPDLVLLVGPAARDGGRAVLQTLMSSPVSSVIPVAILDDNAALDMRLRAFRHGAAAVIAPSASIDAIAEQVSKLAREIPERGGESLGVVGEATLSEFVSSLSKELRSGILSVHTSNSDDEAVRLVLGSGRPLTAFIDNFVRQVKTHIVHAEPLRYEFAEHAGGTVTLLDPEAPDDGPERVSVKGVRVALADDDTGRADTVAQVLRARGVSVVVTDLAPNDLRFTKLRQVDPQVLLIGEAQVKGAGYELLRRMRRDTRLRWASLLVVRWDEIWTDALSVPALDRLETALAALCEADRTLQAWGETGESFDARLEITGPARCLRALTNSPRPLRLTVNNPRVTVSIDISDGLVVGASAESRIDRRQHWDGAVALAAFMVLSSGRIHITPVAQPAVTNVMATIDVALNMADSEPSPISPSVPIKLTTSLAPPPPPAHTHESSAPPAVFGARALRVLGRPRIGVSLPATAFLVALAALHGLLIVAALSFVIKPRAARSIAPSASPSASLSSALAASSDARTSGLTSAPLPSTGGGPAAARGVAEPSAVLATPSDGLPDESGLSAPSCEEALSAAHVTPGDYPGAAYGEMRDANRALVRGDIEAAERAMCTAALWDQQNALIPLEVAQLMLLRRDGSKAVEWAKKALAADPTSRRAQGALGDGLARLGEYEPAKLAWLESMRLGPASEAQFRALSFSSVREAQAALARHDVARAERFFRRAAVLDGENVKASNGLAHALLNFGDTGSALRWANHSVSIAPRDPSARVTLGDVLFQKGDHSAAEVEWREALQLEPSNFIAKLRLRRLAHAR